MHDVAAKIPLAVFMQIADLPSADLALLPSYNETLIDSDGNETTVDVMKQFADYLRPHCADRLSNPGEDFLSRLICGRINGHPLTESEAVDMATTVMTGGIDTVTSALGLCMAHLAHNARLCQLLVENKQLIPNAVLELLRRNPIMTKARPVTKTITIDEVTLVSGEIVVLPPLHGLDERIFEEPLKVDINRTSQPNLSFGIGPHRCPGTLLARAEIEITLTAWLERIPEFTVDKLNPPKMQGGVLGAIQSLGLQWPVQTNH